MSGDTGGPRLSVWKVEDLRAAFKRLCTLPLKFFFLIDGLDEFQDDGGSSVGIIERLIQNVEGSQDVKALVSSRLPSVQSQLDLNPRIDLHELNRDDIRLYVDESLKGSPTSVGTAGEFNDNSFTKIVKYLSDNAAGSFLWAKLAVEIIKRRLSQGQSLHEIQQSLESIRPPLMHDLYQKLWSSMATEHQVDASEILRIMLAGRDLACPRSKSGQVIRLIDLTLALVNPKNTIGMDIKPWNAAKIQEKCRRVANRFTTAWPGFITIDEDSDMISSPIQFSHRSVLEFLELDETRQTLLEASKLGEREMALYPYTAHLNSAVHHLKILPKLVDTDLLPLLWVFVTAALSAANHIDSTESAKLPTHRLLLEQLDNTMQYYHERRMYEGPDYKRR